MEPATGTAAAETARAVGEERGPRRTERAFIERSLEAPRAFLAAVAMKTTTTTLLDEVLPEVDGEVFSGGLRRDFLRKIARTSKGSA